MTSVSFLPSSVDRVWLCIPSFVWPHTTQTFALRTCSIKASWAQQSLVPEVLYLNLTFGRVWEIHKGIAFWSKAACLGLSCHCPKVPGVLYCLPFPTLTVFSPGKASDSPSHWYYANDCLKDRSGVLETQSEKKCHGKDQKYFYFPKEKNEFLRRTTGLCGFLARQENIVCKLGSSMFQAREWSASY